MKTVLPHLALLGLACVLIFPNLGDRYLWDDEAETALLARNVLRFGVPLAFDGKDLISQECGLDYDANYLWRQTPWLPIYLAAASFKLFGASTFSARLPFAFVALASLPSLYLLARRLFHDRRIAWLSVACLTLSVPFLLHVRQCRYYSVTIFATIWVLYFFTTAWERRWGGWIGLALSLTVLFHSNYLIFLGVAVGLILAFLVVRDRAMLRSLTLAGTATVLINAPWLFLLDLRGKSASMLGDLTVARFAWTLGAYLRDVELYAFPSLVLLAALGLRFGLRSAARAAEVSGVKTAAMLAAFAFGHFLLLAALPFVFFRYAVNLLPVFALLLAWVIADLARIARAPAAILLALVLFVDRGDLVSAHAGSTLLKYAAEISHEFNGPIKSTVQYLERWGKPGDRVFITYGDLPLRFYTSFDVRGGQGCQPLVDAPAPDWIVLRYFFRFLPLAPGASEDVARMRDYVRARISSGEYRRIDLPHVDTVWENIPEPRFHVYRVPAQGPPVTLYRRIPASAPSPGLR